jgi:hypothetical protein
MRTALTAVVAFALVGPARAGESKTVKAPVDSQEMDCDHPAAKDGNPSAKVGSKGLIIRGKKIDKPANVQLVDLLASPERQKGKAVVVEGKVRRACERMGCWMELAETDEGPGVRITFKDYGFFVPLDSAGAKAKVAGTVKIVELSNATAAHYESEGGGVARDANGSHREVQLVATGVELRR